VPSYDFNSAQKLSAFLSLHAEPMPQPYERFSTKEEKMKGTYSILLFIVFCSCLIPAFASLEPNEKAESRSDLFELQKFPGWFKPICNLAYYKGCTRLVVKITADGHAVLNPKDEKGGWSSATVDLNGLSLENAELLWGQPRGMTFDLLSYWRPERDVYHLDTKFVHGKLSDYRLRGIEITKPEWIHIDQVNSGGNNVPPEHL
jgi:hypothetical protein